MKEISREIVRQGAAAASLSYIFFACVFVLIYKKNEFARYHAKQALVLFIGLLICWVFAVLVPFLSLIFYGLATIVYVVCCVAGIFSSLMGKQLRFPVVSDIADKMVI